MLSDIHSQNLTCWADPAHSFFGLFYFSFLFLWIESLIVLDHERFAHEILPRWFNFLPSFVLPSDTGEIEHWNFAHENFRRDQPDLL